jgi:HAD superfamily hydrolase (TIGR01490 family)
MKNQKLAMFDLDHTLIKGDSDHAWGEFLAKQGLVDAVEHRRANDRFYADYQAGRLNMDDYLRFALAPLSRHERGLLESQREVFIRTVIMPMVLPKARRLVNEHKAAGDLTLVITSTNRFVAEPIAALFKVDALIATEPEEEAGRFTGEVAGVPSFREGKVTRLRQWMQAGNYGLQGSFFYSDSHNDLPLLEEVEVPVAVDADEQLLAHARRRGWKIISLR